MMTGVTTYANSQTGLLDQPKPQLFSRCFGALHNANLIQYLWDPRPYPNPLQLETPWLHPATALMWQCRRLLPWFNQNMLKRCHDNS